MAVSPLAFEPRAVCLRCRRPERVCYCRHVTPIPTRTRVVLLQHPRERDVPIGTAHMASLCLPNSELCVGIHWEGSPALTRALSDPSRPAALLYPGEDAVDVLATPPPGPVTLLVVDGTWSLARKVVRENPVLARLPRFAFSPPAPSEYRIRREPLKEYVSTIEALGYVLAALEGKPEIFELLLAPFRAMVETQLECAASIRGARVRHKKPDVVPRGPRVPRIFRERLEDLVVVHGEANAWPYRDRQRGDGHPDELVQWIGHRVATGERFDVIATPRFPLAPSTPRHMRVGEEELRAGVSLDELGQRWRAFARESDVVCSWGRYATRLFASSGGWLPKDRVDVRQVARELMRDKVGTIEEFLQRIDAQPPSDVARGRGGMRASQVLAVVRHVVKLASS